MGKNWNAALGYFAFLISIILISGCATKLIDLDKSLPKLSLSEEQRGIVEPKMMAIKELADTYNVEKEEFEEEINSSMEGTRSGGDRSQFQARFQEIRSKREELLKKRESCLSAIKIHIDDIKAALNEEQLATFSKMELPELEPPEEPGRGQRRGPGERGSGGRPGGMDGGGGRRPGGGMF